MERTHQWARAPRLLISLLVVMGLMLPTTAHADEKDKGNKGKSGGQQAQQAQQVRENERKREEARKKDEERRREEEGNRLEAEAKTRSAAESRAGEEAVKREERERAEAKRAEERAREAAKAGAERRENERRAQQVAARAAQQIQTGVSTIHVRQPTLAVTGGHSCNPAEWHFVINQVDGPAPHTITVRWANGATETLPVRVTGKAAHYATTSHLTSQVVDAWTDIYAGWDGNFNLSHGPCGPQQAVLGMVDQPKQHDAKDTKNEVKRDERTLSSAGVLGTTSETPNSDPHVATGSTSEPVTMFGCFAKADGTVVHETGQAFGSQAEMDAYKAAQGYVGIDINRPNPDQCKNPDRRDQPGQSGQPVETAGVQVEGFVPFVQTTVAVAERESANHVVVPSVQADSPARVLTTSEAREQLQSMQPGAPPEGVAGIVSEAPAPPVAQGAVTERAQPVQRSQPAQHPAQGATSVLPSTGEPLVDLALLTLSFLALTLTGIRFVRLGARRA